MKGWNSENAKGVALEYIAANASSQFASSVLTPTVEVSEVDRIVDVAIDPQGKPIHMAPYNCVDLRSYVFVNRLVMTAFRRSCIGEPAAFLTFQEGKVEKYDIFQSPRLSNGAGRNTTAFPHHLGVVPIDAPFC